MKRSDGKSWMDGPWIFVVPIAVFVGAIVVAVVVHAALDEWHVHSLMDIPAWRRFVESATSLGRRILIGSVSIGLALLLGLFVYGLRHGERDESEGKVVDRDGLPGVGAGLRVGRYKAKMLASRNAFAGTGAARSWRDRALQAAIVAFVLCFFLVFVGWGLVLVRDFPPLLLLPLAPGYVLYRMFRSAWSDRKALSPRPGPAAGSQPGSSPPSP